MKLGTCTTGAWPWLGWTGCVENSSFWAWWLWCPMQHNYIKNSSERQGCLPGRGSLPLLLPHCSFKLGQSTAGMGVWLRQATVMLQGLDMASLEKPRSCLVAAGWGCAYTSDVGKGVALFIPQGMGAREPGNPSAVWGEVWKCDMAEHAMCDSAAPQGDSSSLPLPAQGPLAGGSQPFKCCLKHLILLSAGLRQAARTGSVGGESVSGGEIAPLSLGAPN